MYVDCRFVAGNLEETEAAVRALLDEDMTCEVLAVMPGLESPADGPFVEACQRAVHALDDGGLVVPWVVPAGSDAQRLGALGIVGYGFTPLRLPAQLDFLGLFHAIDERIPLDTLVRGYETFRSLVTGY